MERREMGSEAESVGPGRSRRWIGLAAVVITLLSFAGLFALMSLRPRAGSERVPVADVSSERLLPRGAVVGFAADFDTHAWLGIPYARPPVGPLRWRAPEAPVAWADTRDALRFGPPCLQRGSRARASTPRTTKDLPVPRTA